MSSGNVSAEAIHEIARLCRMADDHRIRDASAEPSGVFYTLGSDGSLERHIAANPALSWKADCLDGFADAIEELCRAVPDRPRTQTEGEPGVNEGADCVCSVADAKVLGVMHPHDGTILTRHCVRFALHETGVIQKLKELEEAGCLEGAGRNQMGFVRLLRVDLAGHSTVTSEFLAAMRDVRSSGRTDGEAQLKPGEENFGQTVMRKVLLGQGGAAIPEAVTLSVPIYDERPERYPVECVVEVDLSESGPVFYLLPVSGELQRARVACGAAIATDLGKALDERKLGDRVTVIQGNCP